MFIENIHALFFLPLHDDGIGYASNVPPAVLDSFTAVLVQTAPTPNIMVLGVAVDFQKVAHILDFLNDRLFRLVIVGMINARPAKGVVINKPFCHACRPSGNLYRQQATSYPLYSFWSPFFLGLPST